ncbi:hypothetical protein RclHR1_00010074 [Rhizophagus clarus]|uniref:Uncharacterized protein n=1 Tax=Rhizophagus clarus TaxID=94130 RepID=A0A2Z6Q4X0_9GLOM|nr:hypothetical protein RclHR1_00010074 [Rhizophagus clarus]
MPIFGKRVQTCEYVSACRYLARYCIEKNNSEIMVVTCGIQTNRFLKSLQISLNMDFNSDFISTRNKNLQI